MGVYVIGDIKEPSGVISIATNNKVNIFRRLFTWLFLGWKWISVEKAKELGVR